MNKKNCRDALDIYKKFLVRMDKVASFLKVAENVGIPKGEIPDLTKVIFHFRSPESMFVERFADIVVSVLISTEL